MYLRQKKRVRSAYERIKIHKSIPRSISYAKRVAAETKPRRQHSTHKKKTGWNKRCPNRNRKREGREEKQKLFLPKTSFSGHFYAKTRYTPKRRANHTPGALRLASVTSYLILAWKGQVHLVLSTLSSFLTVFGEFWANQRPYISAPTRIIRRLIVMDWYTAIRTRSLPIYH